MQLLRRLSFIMLLMSLAACGSGDGGLTRDGDDGGGDTTPDPVVIVLALSNTKVTGQEPVTVIATVTQGDVAVVGTVVTFSSSLGAFSPIDGTALTNDVGIAEIILTAGNVRGAGEITATVSTDEEAKIGFSTQGDDIVVGDINLSVFLVDSNGNSTDTITSSKPGKVIATVNGISSPLIVTFVTTVGEIPIATAITDENHQAMVDILAGGSLGAGSVTASITSGETGEVLLVVGSSTVTMGSGTPFVEGVADISLAQISAGATTVVKISIIDDQGNLFTEPVEVNFSSRCASSNPATAILSSPVTTSNGTATSTYLAKGCVNDDQINVTASAGGINLSAIGVVNVQAAKEGSIEFVSATPTHIALQGVGSLERPENSTIIFRVLDTNGNPVNNREVDFSLNTDSGLIQLIPTSAFTNSDGIVQTVVNSGSVAKTIRVTASIKDSSPLLLTQSSELIVSTGIPDQDSFSISASVLNPEGWSRDGTEVVITARLADAFNNPPPPTVVFFTTEGGSIGDSDKQCTSGSDGSCFVIWRSQAPRPEGHILGDASNSLHPPEIQNTMGQKFGGRATITATTIGEESFPDLNGNGRFDLCEVIAFKGGIGKPCNADGTINESGNDITYSGNDVSGRPYDLREAFYDYNEDGYFNPNPVKDDPNNCGFTFDQSCIELGGELEEPADFNSDGIFNIQDGKYNGVLCAEANTDNCSIEKSLDVRDQLTLVMSGSSANVCIASAYDNPGSTISLIRVDQGLVNQSVTVDMPLNAVEIAPTSDALIIARSNALCHAEVLRITYDDDDDEVTPDVSADVINNSYDNRLYIRGENSTSTTIFVSDLHNQPMPAGTIVKFTATAGSVVGPSSFTWPSDNHNGGLAFGVTVKGEKEPKNGSLIVEVTTPSELTTIFSTIGIIIQ
ncbi:MAG: hypothetical protein OCD00_05225 [Colwellia sp.]